MSSEPKPTAYLVIGMHRSGTSALSGMLIEGGGRAPATPIPANEYNAKGYFESKKIVTLNNSLLEKAGTSWVGFENIDWGVLPDDVIEEAKARIVGAIWDEYGDVDGAVIKDPRISRLAGVWLPALEQVGIEPRVIISFRKPREVVESIARRDNMNRYRVLYLWLRYCLDAEALTRRHPRAFVDFADVLTDWPTVERRLEDTVGLPAAEGPQTDGETGDTAEGAHDESDNGDFIDTSLATRNVPEHEVDESDAMAMANKVYDIFQKASESGELDASQRKRLDKIHREFDKATNLFGSFIGLTEAHARHIGRELGNLKQDIADRNAEERAERAESQLKDERARLETLIEKLGDQDLHARRLENANRLVREELQDATRRADELTGTLAEERDTIRDLRAQLEGLSKRVESMSAIEAERDDLVRQLAHARSAEAAARRKLDDALETRRAEEKARAEEDRLAVSLEISALQAQIAALTAATHQPPSKAERVGDASGRTVSDQGDSGETWEPASISAAPKRNNVDRVWRSEDRLLAAPENLRSSRAHSEDPQASGDARPGGDTPARGGALKGPLDEDQVRLLRSGFRAQWYVVKSEEAGVPVTGDPFAHYLSTGLANNISPHPLFDADWYAERYPDLEAVSDRYYLHYLQKGESEGRRPMPLFDPKFYLATNSDVRDSGKAAHVHYYRFGSKEGRLPDPWFNSVWYKATYPEAQAAAGVCSLLDYHTVGEAEGRWPHPSFDPVWYRRTYLENHPIRSKMGALEAYLRYGISEGHATMEGLAPPTNDDRKVVLAVAHSASDRIYGSERSFIDVLQNIDRSQYKIILALPRPSDAYMSLVGRMAEQIHVVPTRWWQAGQPIDEDLVALYRHIIKAHSVDLVYANTIMLREPGVAAREAGIPNIVHIREAIDKDPDLLDYIGLPADEIVERVVERADHVIGNSGQTLRIFGSPDDAFLVYNAVDPDLYADIPPPGGGGTLRVGMLSSNIAKKGIADVVELAKLVHKAGADISFHLYGPLTDEARKLQRAIDKAGLTNIVFEGYADNPRDAVAKLDVMLNFSHFAESFGRTLVEAGSAGRPAIVYDHGALPEVVEDGVTGHVIRYRSPKDALPHLMEFARDRETLRRMGEAAKARVRERFSFEQLAKGINSAFSDILESADTRPTAPVTVVVPNYNYADYLEERLGSIFRQTWKPSKIVFLDDNSSDDSVEVATALLEASGIPYTVVANTENRGVYAQWLTGFAEADTDWVWIAEADDSCEPEFLETLLSGPTDGLNILYSQSRKIDGEGKLIVADNRAHSNDVSTTRWDEDYVASGTREVVDALCFRNTIPNASAVLMRRAALDGAAEVLEGLRYVGDWKLYAHLLRSGGVRFVSESLNHFRRHQRSVTRQKGKETDYLRELVDIRLYLVRHFPIRTEELDRMDWFLNRDYRIDGVATNSRSEIVSETLDEAREIARPRRRFGFITTNNGSFYGGSEMLWRETALSLARDGHDVIVLIKQWDPRPEFLDEMEAAGATILFKDEDGFDRLVALAPELCVVSLGDQDEGLEFYPTLIGSGIPYVIVNQLTKEARFWPIRAQKTEAVKSGYANAETAFFTCWNNHRVMEERLETPLPNGALHYNPYHIDRSHVPAWPDGPTTHIAIPSKLLFIHKGQDILAEFLGKPPWRDRDVMFNFYGIGPDEENLRKLAKSKGIRSFAFHGRVSDISTIWETNHALLMPSRMEGLPIMLVSAMLSARIGIVTDIGGHAEVVTDGESGFIAANPSVEDVRDALERAWSHRAEWEAMGRKARESILDFLPEDPVADFAGKLHAVLDRRNDGRASGVAA